MATTKESLFDQIATALSAEQGCDECPSHVRTQLADSVRLLQLPSGWPITAHSAEKATKPLGFVIVRHGATEWSANGRHTGLSDLPLTSEGRNEAIVDRALLVGGVLAGLSTTNVQVYLSPLQRARTTGALALPDYAAGAITSDLLREWNYGDYEGLTSHEINARLGRSESDSWDVVRDGCPNGEAAHDVCARADAFIARACAEAAGKLVVCFTHGHFSRCLTVRLCGLPVECAQSLQNDTASIALLRWRKTMFVLDAWNIRPPRLRIETSK